MRNEERIKAGARYFYKFKPSQFLSGYQKNWHDLMKLMELIIDDPISIPPLRPTQEKTLYQIQEEIMQNDTESSS